MYSIHASCGSGFWPKVRLSFQLENGTEVFQVGRPEVLAAQPLGPPVLVPLLSSGGQSKGWLVGVCGLRMWQGLVLLPPSCRRWGLPSVHVTTSSHSFPNGNVTGKSLEKKMGNCIVLGRS